MHIRHIYIYASKKLDLYGLSRAMEPDLSKVARLMLDEIGHRHPGRIGAVVRDLVSIGARYLTPDGHLGMPCSPGAFGNEPGFCSGLVTLWRPSEPLIQNGGYYDGTKNDSTSPDHVYVL